MLVLTRKLGEQIIIDGIITITVVDAGGGKVKIGIDAPPQVRVLRQELLANENEDAKPVPVSPCASAGLSRTARPNARGSLRCLRKISR
jgi:carbon storage regulator